MGSVSGFFRSPRTRSLGAYCLVGLAWFAVAKLILSVRVRTELWTPVFEWAYVQRLGVLHLRFFGLEFKGLWLLLHLVVAIALWLAIEVLPRWRFAHYWRRAILTWTVLEVCLWSWLQYLVARSIVAE